MNSMMTSLLICFCAIAFAGAVSVSSSLDVLIRLLAPVKSTFTLIASSGHARPESWHHVRAVMSLQIPGEVLRGASFTNRTIEDAATVRRSPILPWTSAGAYMAGTWASPGLHALGDLQLDRVTLRPPVGRPAHRHREADPEEQEPPGPG